MTRTGLLLLLLAASLMLNLDCALDTEDRGHDIPAHLEVSATYQSPFSISSPHSNYRIVLQQGLNGWAITVADGPSFQNTVYVGDVSEAQVRDLYEAISQLERDQSRYLPPFLETGTDSDHASVCILQVIASDQMGRNLLDPLQDARIMGPWTHDKEVTYLESAIEECNPFEQISEERASEKSVTRIHKTLVELARKNAISRVSPVPSTSISEPFSQQILSSFGEIELVSPKEVFDQGHTIEMTRSLDNAINHYWSRFDSSDTTIFILKEGKVLQLRNRRVFIEQGSAKQPVSSAFASYNSFILSENKEHMLFGVDLELSEVLLFYLDIEDGVSIQVLDHPVTLDPQTDIRIGNEGEVFFQLNAEIYKWHRQVSSGR